MTSTKTSAPQFPYSVRHAIGNTWQVVDDWSERSPFSEGVRVISTHDGHRAAANACYERNMAQIAAYDRSKADPYDVAWGLDREPVRQHQPQQEAPSADGGGSMSTQTTTRSYESYPDRQARLHAEFCEMVTDIRGEKLAAYDRSKSDEYDVAWGLDRWRDDGGEEEV